MNTSTKRARQQARKAARLAFTLSPVAAGCALLLAGAPGVALAQSTAAAADGQQVVVTGIRRGIEDAVSIKRTSDSIVEAVSAEDIGKLPDISIAESIARLPGLTAQRVAGRAQVISLRGLAPDFAGTLINGREFVSTSDNRAAEYDQFPSELINSATIYKTPDAGLVGQGLSGTVDMQTVRPLNFNGRQVNFNIRGSHNSLGRLNENTSPNGMRFSASLIDQNAERTFGYAIGFAHLDNPGMEKHYKSWWWDAQPTDLIGAANAGAVALGGAEVEAISRKQVRDGVLGVLEFRPNKDVKSVVDLYYSKFEQKETMRGVMWSSNQWDGISYTAPTSTTVDGSKILTGGTVHNIRPIVRNDYNTRDDKISAIGWNHQVKFDNGWTAISDLSYSNAKRNERVLETYAGLTGGLTDSLKFSVPTGYGLSQFTPGRDYANTSQIFLGDPGGWGRDGLMNSPRIDDTIKSLRLQGKKKLDGVFSSLDVGLNYTNREKTRASVENNIELKNGRAPLKVGSDILDTPSSLAFAGIPAVLAYDVMGALGKYYNILPDNNTNVWKRDFTISEKITTFFGKASFEGDLGVVPVHGNLGLQYVRSDQKSRGLNNNGASSGEAARGANYNDVLPSLNMTFDVAPDTYVRFGAARSLARPRIDDLKAGSSAGVDVTKGLWSGQGGNPELKPWKANAFDLSLEKYFGKRSYVAVATFHKKLLTYIYNKESDFDFTGFPNPGNTPVRSNIGTLTMPANGEGGTVNGLEFSAALEGSMLTPVLDGFGAVYSFSKTRSSIKPNGPGSTETLPGLSGIVNNLTLYYEKDGFSTRVSQRYRSEYRGEVTGLFTDRTFSQIAAEKQVDFQVGYAFEKGTFKGMSILFQVNNATDEPYRTSNGRLAGGTLAPEQYHTYGRQYLLGLSYKL